MHATCLVLSWSLAEARRIVFPESEIKEEEGGVNMGHIISFTVLLIGGLNWLLYGLFQWEVGQLFGGMDASISRLIYVLVGLAAIYEIATHKSTCKLCMGMKGKK